MMLKEARPIIRKAPRRELHIAGQDLSQLSASLRELALRSYHLVRASNGLNVDAQSADLDRKPELFEVRERIVELQRSLRDQQLPDLVAYVTALRQRVEEQLR